jgi:magnesium-transporting ATPase (P-type)
MERQDLLLLQATNVLAHLHSSEEGLRQSEADARRVTYGLNVLKKSKNTALRILGRQLKSSLIYLLMFASALCFFLKDISDGVIIAVILLINTCLGFFKEAVKRHLAEMKVVIERNQHAPTRKAH